ncbi:hypothetical protein TOPH_06224 [Tolypocladium ophioglossoides CBS 100239]|uniref:Prolyl 4-hydroxylase alpha subunit Fe(2+) 2OG dioxygenase domain-containing protein n=1 Tax=Tolypocladium ophioglossoides (strain CBS 100239) TaxID=1163406 RepID=A0A0L0N505_TOLOC|nr:hypothetical protein TOPH_06224 [Tolypocladium ophioglossoides CBS 100239]
MSSSPTPAGRAGNLGENEPLESLRRILESQSHLFACGGVVPIRKQAHAAPFPQCEEQKTSNPVTIRWDAAGNADGQATPCAKITLPLDPGADANMNRLVQHSQPATFGRGGEDVYDESYREARKMDPTAFCTTFDPYSLGIVDTVAQVLLPSVVDSITHRAVYSGPSGKFKRHVDTPRSPSQFGSLVVCLPVAHQGGQLKVRHEGEELAFDWSNSGDEPEHVGICWAAFYSDCEHEVLEVTSGHRLTLTYNLYAVRGAGSLTGVSPTLDPAHLPLFQAVKAMLGQDPFGGQGSTLGFWCSHVYAYNHETETPLPDTLKGVDAVLWENFRNLDLHPKIAPVIKMPRDIRSDLSEFYDDRNQCTMGPAMRRRENLPSEMPSEWIIGRKFGVHVHDALQAETLGDYNHMYECWGAYSREPIRWLTKPAKSELQLVYMAYGNQATSETMYSGCAILVTIPPKVE